MEAAAKAMAKRLVHAVILSVDEESPRHLVDVIAELGVETEKQFGDRMTPAELTALGARILEIGTEAIHDAQTRIVPGPNSIN